MIPRERYRSAWRRARLIVDVGHPHRGDALITEARRYHGDLRTASGLRWSWPLAPEARDRAYLTDWRAGRARDRRFYGVAISARPPTETP